MEIKPIQLGSGEEYNFTQVIKLYTERIMRATLLPISAFTFGYITIHRAADILNVSVDYIIDLYRSKELHMYSLTTSQGIAVFLKKEEVLAWKEENYKKRCQALDELAALSQESGL